MLIGVQKYHTSLRKNKNSIHNSTKMAPIQAAKKSTESKVYSNLQDRRIREKPSFKLV